MSQKNNTLPTIDKVLEGWQFRQGRPPKRPRQLDTITFYANQTQKRLKKAPKQRKTFVQNAFIKLKPQITFVNQGVGATRYLPTMHVHEDEFLSQIVSRIISHEKMYMDVFNEFPWPLHIVRVLESLTFQLDKQGNFVDMNREFERLRETSKKELLGNSFEMFLKGEDLTHCAGIFAQLLNGVDFCFCVLVLISALGHFDTCNKFHQAITRSNEKKYTISSVTVFQKERDGTLKNVLFGSIFLDQLSYYIMNCVKQRNAKNLNLQSLTESLTDIITEVQRVRQRHQLDIFENLSIPCVVCCKLPEGLIVQFSNKKVRENGLNILGKCLDHVLFSYSWEIISQFVEKKIPYVEVYAQFIGTLTVYKATGHRYGEYFVFHFYEQRIPLLK